MDDWLPFVALGIALWALLYAVRAHGTARAAAEFGIDSRVRLAAYRGLTHDGRRHVVVIEIPVGALASNPELVEALMSAPPDGPAAPDHTVPLWQRNGGYEA